ncbi:NADPH-dependent FMN reductase [Knoellia koreensis]|uniref:NAD(P)H-dependent oxidoreductase n=1 Tax=Knoellia koreensis TaxID=2730921 RepID=A0A849H438_9MICO|nr:NADPH-dependent FMN reductase [Knoellia sp. DB2414S]NNM44546.1 NAD(P)H-dependent oxidoreductase [Knoellia sp. DB2414S]
MATATRPLVTVVVGSTRPIRVGDQITQALAPVIAEEADARVEVVDLRDLDLPLLDEPRMPALGDYAHDHTKDWARTIEASDAVVIVSPQYNGGYPAGLKNAIDFLYAEWKERPVLIVTYGGHGGGMSGAQLRHVLEFIGAAVLPENVEITLKPEFYDADWRLVDAQAAVAEALPALREAAGLLGERAREDERVSA